MLALQLHEGAHLEVHRAGRVAAEGTNHGSGPGEARRDICRILRLDVGREEIGPDGVGPDARDSGGSPSSSFAAVRNKESYIIKYFR